MNRTFAAATGDPICVIDQDLIFEQDWLSQVHRILASAPTEGHLATVYGVGGETRHTLVDSDDADLVEMYRWKLNTGYAAVWQYDPERYARGLPAQVVVALHQLLMQPAEGAEVDHRNRRRLDNRRCNLRVVDKAVNRRNVGANAKSTSPYRGVSFSGRLSKWVAQAQGDDGKSRHIGCYEDEVEAAWACEGYRRQYRPDSYPDPVLLGGVQTPPIGVLSGFHYHHDPCDWRKTIRARYDGWEEHEYIMGSFMAIPRVVWEALGPFEQRSDAFAEDHVFQRKVTDSGLWVCGTPERDLMRNVGYGVGPSTVVVAPGTVATIHHGPRIYGV